MRLSLILAAVLVAGCAGEVPPVVAQSTPYYPLNFPQTDHPNTHDALVINRAADFPCLTCLAWVSNGGGRFGATASILDLHVISDRADIAFPRALIARLESECAACQPSAATLQARGLSPATTVWAVNMEAYSAGRAVVNEMNIGAAAGGYVMDVVPVRLPNGAASLVDAVIKVEGFGSDPGAAQIGTYIDARINPTRAITIIPADQGPVTVMETADGRMKEVWAKDGNGRWTRQIWIDGALTEVTR